jgi:hypothetical protein
MGEAKPGSESQLQTIRRKTARLKAERLATETGERQSELDTST